MSRKVWVVHGGARSPVATRTHSGAVSHAMNQTLADRTGDVIVHDETDPTGRVAYHGPDRMAACVHVIEVEILEI